MGKNKIEIYIFFNPLVDRNFGRDPQKNFLWASRLWVGRRKDLILSYVTKNKEIKTSCSNG